MFDPMYTQTGNGPRSARHSSGACCFLGKEAHTLDTCSLRCLQTEEEALSLVKKICEGLACEDPENRDKMHRWKEDCAL